MAESSGFFNAVETNGVRDRTYLAEDFAGYFANFISNGIYGATLNGFAISTNTGTQTVTIGAGKAFINGYWFNNTAAVELSAPLPAVSTTYYSVFIRLDMTSRTISLVMSPGTTSGYTNPTRNDTIWDLRIWIVSATATQYQTNDRRGVTADCGFVTGLITQIDTTSYQNQLNDFVDGLISSSQTTINGKLTAFDTWITNQQTTATADWNAFKAQANALISGGQDSIQQQITDFGTWVTQQQNTATAQIQNLIDQLQELIDSGDVSSLVDQVANLTTLVNTTNSALSGKMDKLPNATVGTNLAVGAGGNAVSTGRVSIDVDTPVGGVLLGTMPNPGLSQVPQTNTTITTAADYGQVLTVLDNISVASTGRFLGKAVESITLPARPHTVVANDTAAVAITNGNLALIYE